MDTTQNLIIYLIEGFETEGMKRMASTTDNVSELLERLWKIVVSNKYPQQWRAAWFLEQVIVSNPEYANQFLPKVLKAIPEFNHQGQLRHSLKVILLSDINLWDLGQMLDMAWSFMMSENQPPAVRVHAMEIVFRIVMLEPDLESEFVESLKLISRNESPGIKSRVNRTLMALQKAKKNKYSED